MFDGINDALFLIAWPWNLILVFVLMLALGFAAYRGSRLTLSGSAAAVAAGTIVLWCTHTEGFVLICLFYVSSYMLSFVRKKVSYKQSDAGFCCSAPEEKGDVRDWVQVAANGLCFTLCALFYYNSNSITGIIMFASAVSESTSDTWAGEIGRLSKDRPVSLRTFMPVEKGLSGGVTLLGFSGALAGSTFISFALGIFCNISFKYCLIPLVSGFAGCILDSYLGATVQAVYRDFPTGKLTEKRCSSDFKQNTLVRGIPWIDNDIVNFVSNAASVVISMCLCAFFL